MDLQGFSDQIFAMHANADIDVFVSNCKGQRVTVRLNPALSAQITKPKIYELYCDRQDDVGQCMKEIVAAIRADSCKIHQVEEINGVLHGCTVCGEPIA